MTENPRLERPNTIPWPPMLVVGFIALGVALNWLVPLGWPTGGLGDLLTGLGFSMVAIALSLAVTAMRTMAQAQTTILPHRRSDHLVTKGVFGFSRNPIYVANVILIAGLGLFLGNWWLLLLAPVDGFATQKLAIEREEAHLEARFGKTYRDYKKKVNRWL